MKYIFVKLMKACMYNNLVIHVSFPRKIVSQQRTICNENVLNVGISYFLSILQYITNAPLISFYWSFHYIQIYNVLIICHKLCQQANTLWYFNWFKIGLRRSKTSMLIACSYSQGCLQQDIANDHLNTMILIC